MQFFWNKSSFSRLTAVALLGGALTLSSCGGDDGAEITEIPTPNDYSFVRNGASTVSYTGQTSRLNQLGEIKAYMSEGDGGAVLSAQALKDMFANTDGNGGGKFSQVYAKDIKSKTFEPDQAYFEGLMDAMAADSEIGNTRVIATEGKAGLLTRGNGNTILVDKNGHEYTQLIEKGLMGATFYYQIAEVYLTDAKIGPGVENDEVEEGENYTAMEHHWDEAFGYYGVPVDFPANTEGIRFWGNYSNGRDALLGTNAAIMDAFIAGRTAIVNKNYELRDANRDIVYEELERVVAGTALHYMNSALAANNTGDYMHVLSEAYVFTQCLKYSSRRKISLEQINTILDTHIGENFWNTTASGLNEAKDLLSSLYGFEDVKDDL